MEVIKLEKTCGNCPKINVSDAMGMLIFGCKETGFVIPHYASNVEKEVIFWRVPNECPRSSNEVFKSEKKAPQKDWIIKTFADFS